MDAEQTLRNVPLFGGLQQKQLKSLARWATTRTWQPGQVIVQQGQGGLGLYCIQSGRVRVSRHTDALEQTVREMGPGESFGEMALLDDQPRSATVTAVEPTTAVLLDKAQFLAELRTYPEIALAIIPALVQRLREAEDRTGRS